MLTLMRFARRAAPLGLVFSLLGACGDSTGSADILFTASGPLNNVSGQPLPAGARVVVAWVVSAGSPDYTYVFGEGTVQGNTFQVRFTAPPPTEALNAGQLGVGIVLLTSGTELHSGMRLEDAPANTVLLGATGDFAVIYKASDPVVQVDWAGAFPVGFGAGMGVERPANFDAFEPVAPTSLELIVDDLANIDFVNWT